MSLTIYYFSHYNPSAACVRYRGKYLLENLKDKKNVEYYFIYPDYSIQMISRFMLVLFKIMFTKTNGLIICQKIYRPRLYSRILYLLIQHSGLKSVYDIDDAYFVNYGDSVINKFITASNKVITGSQSLLQYSNRINPNSERIPSSVFDQKMKLRIQPLKTTLGFVGSLNYYLPVLMDQVFPAILEIKTPIKLVILGINRDYHPKLLTEYFQENKNIELILPQIKNWENESVIYDWIKTFSFGLSPLTNSIIDNSKSAFKMKQYFSCGVPVLGSDIGENNTIISNKHNGFICNSKTDYFNAILKLDKMENEEYNNWQLNSLNSISNYYYDDFTNMYWNSLNSINKAKTTVRYTVESNFNF
jgi:glycosyltransferase involved in cell wall biosynthesis